MDGVSIHELQRTFVEGFRQLTKGKVQKEDT